MAAKMLTSLLMPPSFGFKVQTTNFLIFSLFFTTQIRRVRQSQVNFTTNFTKNSQIFSQKQPTIEKYEKNMYLSSLLLEPLQYSKNTNMLLV